MKYLYNILLYIYHITFYNTVNICKLPGIPIYISVYLIILVALIINFSYYISYIYLDFIFII